MIKKYFFKFINILFVLVMGILFFLSTYRHYQLNLDDFSRTITNHRPYVYIMLLILWLCIALGLVAASEKWKINDKVLFNTLLGITILVCLGWLLFNDSAPRYDQETLYKEAKIIAGYSNEAYNSRYMIAFKRQRLIVLLIAAGLKIFGNNYLGFRLLNLIGAIAIYYGIHKNMDIGIAEKKTVRLVQIFIFLYYPIIVYISFLYGTMWSAAGSVWCFYFLQKWMKDNRVRNAVGIGISISLGIGMHQSAAIALVAIALFLLLYSTKHTIVKNAAVIIFCLLCVVCLNRTIDFTYESITGLAKGDSLPPLATVAMGLTSETVDGGPGAQDGSFYDIYSEHNYDASETNKAAIEIIKKALVDFGTGERSISFFWKKLQLQWLDPTFGAKKTVMINWEEPYNWAGFKVFYKHPIRDVIFKIEIAFMMLMYLFASITGIHVLLSKEDEWFHNLIQLFVIGGVTFSMIWETLSRYCFPYYLWVIVEGTYGIILMYNWVCQKYEKCKIIESDIKNE